MNLLIVGPGALGCLLAARLTEAGVPVTLLDHRRERAEFITRRGILVEREGLEHRVPVPVTADAAVAEWMDLVIVCVKAYQTRGALEALSGRVGKNAHILTLQNGLGNLEALVEVFGQDRAWGGVTAQGATELGLGQIRQAGAGDTVISSAGSFETQKDLLEQTARLFEKAGMPARVEAEVNSVIWSKLVVNVGINALTAVTRLRNGQLLEYPEAEQIMEGAVAEVVAVSQALGIRLMYPDPLERVRGVARATSENIASMLQDVLAKRRTEIGHINAAVVEEGRKLGLPTPINATLAGLVKTIESSYGRGV